MLLVPGTFLLASGTAYAQDNTDNILGSESPFAISAYAEPYYEFNPDNLVGKKPSFLVSYSDNDQLSLNLAFIKGTYTTNNARANLALAAGSYVGANYAAESGFLKHVFLANAGIKLSADKNLWLDAGILPSHIGFQSPVGKENWTLTRSISAENTPYFETGVRISYTSENEKWYLSASVVDGWQRIQPVAGNTTPAFGTQFTYKLSPEITLNSSTFIGNDKSDSARRMRYFHNFYGTYKLNDKLTAMIGFDIGTEQKYKNSSGMNTWLNPEIMLRYTPTAKTAIAARAEYYDDKHGVIITSNTTKGFKVLGLSINFDYKIADNILWRAEVKTLRSNDNIFTRNDGTTTANTIFTMTSLAVSF